MRSDRFIFTQAVVPIQKAFKSLPAKSIHESQKNQGHSLGLALSS